MGRPGRADCFNWLDPSSTHLCPGLLLSLSVWLAHQCVDTWVHRHTHAACLFWCFHLCLVCTSISFELTLPSVLLAGFKLSWVLDLFDSQQFATLSHTMRSSELHMDNLQHSTQFTFVLGCSYYKRFLDLHDYYSNYAPWVDFFEVNFYLWT